MYQNDLIEIITVVSLINFVMGVENSINLIIVFKKIMHGRMHWNKYHSLFSLQSLSCKIFNFQLCIVPDRIFVIKMRADSDM